MSNRSELVSLMRVSKTSPYRTCQWPFGEPGTEDFHFCGRSTAEGFSYCAAHVKMAYREPESRRDSLPRRNAA